MFLSEKEMRAQFIQKLDRLLKWRCDDCPDDAVSGCYKSRAAFYRYLSEKYGGMFSVNTLHSWGKARKSDTNAAIFVPDVFKICVLCDELDCDLEYFFTDQAIPRRAAVSVGNYLGVDPATAERIRGITDKKTLEYISTPTLAAPGGWLEEFLFNVRSCLKWVIRERAALKSDSRKMSDFTKEMADCSKYRFTKNIDRCLNEMADIVENDAAEYLKD